MNSLQVKAHDLIAVYGLLRAGQSGFKKFKLGSFFSYVGPCSISGILLDMGGFPGLFAGKGSVKGDLFRVIDPEIMSKLDEFEDFWPKSSKTSRYDRRLTNLLDPENTKAWVYHCLLPQTGRELVPDGNWVNWYKQHWGAGPYSDGHI